VGRSCVVLELACHVVSPPGAWQRRWLARVRLAEAPAPLVECLGLIQR